MPRAVDTPVSIVEDTGPADVAHDKVVPTVSLVNTCTKHSEYAYKSGANASNKTVL